MQMRRLTEFSHLTGEVLFALLRQPNKELRDEMLKAGSSVEHFVTDDSLKNAARISEIPRDNPRLLSEVVQVYGDDSRESEMFCREFALLDIRDLARAELTLNVQYWWLRPKSWNVDPRRWDANLLLENIDWIVFPFKFRGSEDLFSSFTWSQYVIGSVRHLVLDIPCGLFVTNEHELRRPIVLAQPQKPVSVRFRRQDTSYRLDVL